MSDREVDLHANAVAQSGQSASGVSVNSQGTRGTGSGIGGERRPNTVLDESRESFGNH
jgi:hypothetical protein